MWFKYCYILSAINKVFADNICPLIPSDLFCKNVPAHIEVACICGF